MSGDDYRRSDAIHGITSERIAAHFGIHRNTLARWRRQGLLPGGVRAIHPSGRGWTTVYGPDVFSRVETVKRLTSRGLDAANIRKALEQFEASRRIGASAARAVEIYDSWTATLSQPSAVLLPGTVTERDVDDLHFTNFLPISMHVPFAVRQVLEAMGLSTSRCDTIMAAFDGELVRQGIRSILQGFAPILVINGASVFVAPDVALSPLHSGEDNPPPARKAEDTTSTYEAHWWATQGPGYITVRLYPILKRVWLAWGKEPVPVVSNWPAPVIRVEAGDEVVEYDCGLDVPGSGRMVAIDAYPLAYSARRSAMTKNDDLNRLLGQPNESAAGPSSQKNLQKKSRRKKKS